MRGLDVGGRQFAWFGVMQVGVLNSVTLGLNTHIESDRGLDGGVGLIMASHLKRGFPA